ncbi:hypothetical protein DyAD56_16060 [Dyella sp. AD56]|uniref:hypothetical protein n=1 Tax=Dyella sp. AD56 TaxID=1528744 RepID=UPI000C83B5BA|nr:hypothetical protein [Dyella sp. AD56]PMQ04203.1 hypothetical protein DyAD56_16060 [Dyella sp. AD56]
MAFKFRMKAKVKIKVSGETGTIIGRADYEAAENNYRVRYVAKTGTAAERWWTESALVAATTSK